METIIYIFFIAIGCILSFLVVRTTKIGDIVNALQEKADFELHESLCEKFTVSSMGEYSKSKTEHGNTIVLFRTTIKYHPGDNHISIGTGVNLSIKEGYYGIVHPRRDIAKSGLTFIPSVIFPEDKSEVILDFYLSQNPKIQQGSNYYAPYELGNAIGFVTIVKAG